MTGMIQDRPPNFRSEDGRLYLVRCYACGGEHGRENWAMAVASGQCLWCGWREPAANERPAACSAFNGAEGPHRTN